MQHTGFEYAPSWLIACALGALLFSALLYYKNNLFSTGRDYRHYLLGSLRFLSTCITLVLLLGLIFQSFTEESKEPIVVIARDVSESIGETIDNQELNENIQSLKHELEKQFKIDELYFGSKIRLREDSIMYSDKTTDIDGAIEYISDVYEGENLAASIMITDGIYNRGKNPIYSDYNQLSPIYSVALGDTTPIVDLALAEVLYNQIGYLNDRIELQVDISANDCENQFSLLHINKRSGQNTALLYEERIRIDAEDFFATRSINIDLDESGLIEYIASLTPLNSEQNRNNNSQTFYIDVLDARQNILLLANAPHPDVATLKQILSKNNNYEVSIEYEVEKADTKDIDLVIFHNLPSEDQNIETVLNQLNRSQTPRLIIVGNQTALNRFNASQNIIQINGQSGITNDSEAGVQADFNNFNISDELYNRLKRYPPLTSPFGAYSFNRPEETFLLQSIGGIETDFPLLSFVESDQIKWTFLFGEGLWKWKYFDYIEEANDNLISELIDKTIVYTSTKEDKRKFRVSSTNRVYQENEEIRFVGELYNSNYELINEPEAFVSLVNPEGDEFTYTFSKSNKGYTLNAGIYPVGRYTYQANTTHAGNAFKDSGQFTIKKIETEKSNLQANHNILYSIAAKTNGRVFYPNELAELINEFALNEQMKPVLYQKIINRNLLDYKWLCGLLISLLSLEWFFRRYFGGY